MQATRRAYNVVLCAAVLVFVGKLLQPQFSSSPTVVAKFQVLQRQPPSPAAAPAPVLATYIAPATAAADPRVFEPERCATFQDNFDESKSSGATSGATGTQGLGGCDFTRLEFHGQPKSGTTWSLSLLADLHLGACAENPATCRMPPPGRSPDNINGCKFTISQRHHAPMPTNLSANPTFRHIIVTRDPRDQIVSLAHWLNYSSSRYERMFATGASDSDAIRTMRALAFDFKQAEALGPSRAIVVAYECLLHDTVGQLARIAQFLGLGQLNMTTLTRIRDKNSLDLSRARERGSKHQVVRCGVFGAFRHTLPEHVQVEAAQRMSEILPPPLFKFYIATLGELANSNPPCDIKHLR